MWEEISLNFAEPGQFSFVVVVDDSRVVVSGDPMKSAIAVFAIPQI